MSTTCRNTHNDREPRVLNEFTGASDKTLRTRLKNLERDWKAVRSGEGHSGSPGEGILERIDALKAELKRRQKPRYFGP